MTAGSVARRLGWILGAVERQPGRTIAAVGLLFAVAYGAAFASGISRGPVMRGDAIQYYAYLRSMVFDRDLDFRNEYAHFYVEETAGDAESGWLSARTPAGRPPNMMSVGPALLWAPPYVVVVTLLWFASLLGYGSAPDGFSTGLQLTAGLAGVGYATAGAWLSYLSARRLFDARAALWATLVAWLGGPALYYSVISPTYSHATSFFTVALFVLVWLRTVGRDDNARAIVLGLAGGLAALVRWQDAVVMLLPAWELLSSRAAGRLTTRRLASAGGCMTLGLLVMLIPQLLAWRAVYGATLLVPQGGSFMRWGEPALLEVLFSTRHGLFLWTPALLISAIGLWWLRRRDRMVGVASMLTLAAAVYVNASVSDWWAGEAFGARRFVSYTPLFGLGLAALGGTLDRAGRILTLSMAALGLVAYNGLFLLQYQLFMRGHTDLVPYPETVRQILVDRLILPFRLLSAWLHG